MRSSSPPPCTGKMAMAEPHWEESDCGSDVDDISEFLPCFRFEPTEQDLLRIYLRRRATGRRMPPLFEAAFPTLVLFADDAEPPWHHHPATATSDSASASASASVTGPSSSTSSSCSTSNPTPSFSDAHLFHRCMVPRDATDWFYCFARTTPRGPGSRRTTKAGTFKFKRPGGDGSSSRWAPTNWVMHQYKLRRKPATTQQPSHGDSGGGGSSSSSQLSVDPSEEKDLVLCRFRCTKPTVRGGEAAGVLLPQPLPSSAEEEAEDVSCRQRKRQRTGTAGTEGAEEVPAGGSIERHSYTGSRTHLGTQPPTTTDSVAGHPCSGTPMACWCPPPVLSHPWGQLPSLDHAAEAILEPYNPAALEFADSCLSSAAETVVDLFDAAVFADSPCRSGRDTSIFF